MSIIVRPSADAIICAEKYLEARARFDRGVRTGGPELVARLTNERYNWALLLADSVAEAIVGRSTEPELRAEFRPIVPERGDDRELEARQAAQDALHREPGVGTVQPLRDTQPAPPDEDEPSMGDQAAAGGAL